MQTQTKELICARKTSHIHNNKDLNGLQELSPGMHVNTRYINSLLQAFIDRHFVPTPWKMSTIISVPKRSTPKQLKAFRPVALTSLVMKTLEKIMKSFSLSAVEPMLDPLQFAYRAERGVDDGKLFLLDKFCST